MLSHSVLALLLLSLAGPVSGGDVSVQGTVIIAEGKARLVRPQEKDTFLTSSDPFIAATFRDSRISGREMKLEGKFLPDGSFEIKQFHVVHGGTLYRLIYFCDT
jgi:hypothetical protein